jgi:hypothetical protein
MKKLIYSVCVCACLFISISYSTVFAQQKDENLIQVAVLLDVSNSMDGLINQAKSQLWKIVNEFALARKSGKIPQLQVALYEYGKSSLEQNDGYIRQVVPLSTDLDKISEELFQLATNGGDEYCGAVIAKAAGELEWSKSNDIMKVIFIAGNEPFTQGKVNYKMACKEAIAKGIIVNTIFCGNYNEGVSTRWKDAADFADGTYSNIDQNQKIAYINAPQDAEIKKLGEQLNLTYVSFGKKGKSMKARQKRQDKNAESLASGVMVQRSLAKASKQYNNAGWDLVDAEEKDEDVLNNIKKEDLPEEMKNMNEKGRKEYIEGKRKEREELQKKISQLNEDRRKYISNEQKKMSNENTLDQAIIKAIHKQAKNKKYTFEK